RAGLDRDRAYESIAGRPGAHAGDPCAHADRTLGPTRGCSRHCSLPVLAGRGIHHRRDHLHRRRLPRRIKTMPLNTAIRYLKKGEWQKAHEIAQADESKLGCWAHGIVHLVEGDLGNARYWYRRAGRPFPKDRDVDREVSELTRALKADQ